MTSKALQVSSRLEGLLLVALISTFTVGGPATAIAQLSFQPNPGAFVAQWGAQQQAIQEDMHRSTWASHRPPHAAAQLSRHTINTAYSSDPTVAARVRRQFPDFIAKTSGARAAQDVRAAFTRIDPIATWGRQAAPDGMRLGDVADAMAEYWVSNWLMANHQTGDAPPGRVRDVRDQVRRVLSGNPAFARLDNAQRQEMAEVFIYNTILQGSIYQDAVHKRDQSLLQRMSDAAVTRFRNEAHIDLRAVTLTPRRLRTEGLRQAWNRSAHL